MIFRFSSAIESICLTWLWQEAAPCREIHSVHTSTSRNIFIPVTWMQFCRPSQKIVCSDVSVSVLHKIRSHSGFIYICLYFILQKSLPGVSFGYIFFSRWGARNWAQELRFSVCWQKELLLEIRTVKYISLLSGREKRGKIRGWIKWDGKRVSKLISYWGDLVPGAPAVCQLSVMGESDLVCHLQYGKFFFQGAPQKLSKTWQPRKDLAFMKFKTTSNLSTGQTCPLLPYFQVRYNCFHSGVCSVRKYKA